MATKLLLIKDVDVLGRSGDIVSVRDGYARNFLIPLGHAVKADKNALRRQAALQEERQKQAIADKADAEKLATLLEQISIEIETKVDHEGHMYGSVSAIDIIRIMKEQKNIELEKRFILLKQPIKTIGAHRVHLKLKEGVPASFDLKITPEGVDFNSLVENAQPKAEQA